MSFNPSSPARERTPFGNFELNRTHLRTGVTRVPYANETPAPNLTTNRREALVLCGLAHDADDARQLLDALGFDLAVRA